MATFDQLPVFKDSYDLMFMVFRDLDNVPRDIKFTLVQSLRQNVIELIENIYRANCSTQKSPYICKCREAVVSVTIKMRLLHDLRHISTKYYAHASLHIETVSKQLTAWQKYADTQEAVQISTAIGSGQNHRGQGPGECIK